MIILFSAYSFTAYFLTTPNSWFFYRYLKECFGSERSRTLEGTWVHFHNTSFFRNRRSDIGLCGLRIWIWIRFFRIRDRFIRNVSDPGLYLQEFRKFLVNPVASGHRFSPDLGRLTRWADGMSSGLPPCWLCRTQGCSVFIHVKTSHNVVFFEDYFFPFQLWSTYNLTWMYVQFPLEDNHQRWWGGGDNIPCPTPPDMVVGWRLLLLYFPAIWTGLARVQEGSFAVIN